MQSFLKTGKINASEKPSTSASNKVNASKRQQHIPWVEKYRPKVVDDVVQQPEVVAVLKECLTGADLPNLLFYGPPGTGKTTTILAIARQLFADMFKDRILELNSSDERGIQVIRERVKNFAQIAVTSTRPDGKPCPPFKIIILDEADSMTHAAQTALRRTMERESKSTRFCLICNYVTRIIAPLTSRCTKFRFKSIASEHVIDRLQFICREENVEYDAGALETIVETSGGDMRKAITCLQSCSKLKGRGHVVTIDDVVDVMAVVPPSIVKDFFQICRELKYQQLERFIDQFWCQGFSTAQFLEQLNEEIVFMEQLTSKQKIDILKRLGVCSYRLQNGCSDYTILTDFGYSTIEAIKSK